MTRTANRPIAMILAALVAVALWMPTVSTPSAQASTIASVPVELA